MAGRATPLMRPMRSSADAMVAPVLPARHHGRRPAVADGLGGPHQRRVLHGADARPGVGVHADDLGGGDHLEVAAQAARGRRAGPPAPPATPSSAAAWRAPSTIAPGALSPPMASTAIGSGSPGELAVSGALSGVTRDAGRSVDLDGHAAAVPAAVAAHDVRQLGRCCSGGRRCARACRVARRSPGGCGSWPWRSSSWGRPWESSCDVSWWGRRRARPRPRGGHGEERLAAPVPNRRTTRSPGPGGRQFCRSGGRRAPTTGGRRAPRRRRRPRRRERCRPGATRGRDRRSRRGTAAPAAAPRASASRSTGSRSMWSRPSG